MIVFGTVSSGSRDGPVTWNSLVLVDRVIGFYKKPYQFVNMYQLQVNKISGGR